MADLKSLNELKLKLKLLECPFSWDMPVNNDMYIDKFLTILNQRSKNIEEENDFKWTSFNIHLVLSFEFWKQKGDYVNAMLHIDACIEELNRLREAGCREQLFLSINGALWHVALATKANLHYNIKDLVSTSQTILNVNMKPKRTFTKIETAGILGIRAAVYRQYKPFGFDMALKMARNASRLDPQQAEWHFIIANCLGRIRRMKKGAIVCEESDEMKQAYTLQKDATYSVHTAQMFADFANYIHYNRYDKSICSSEGEAAEISKNYSKYAVKLYRKALTYRPYCPGLKIRVAHGLIRIPDLAFVDYQWAKQLLDEAAVHLPESAMLYHDLGRYYDKFKNPEKAILNLKKAHELHNYPAFTYLVILWWKYNCDWDLVSEIKAAFDKYVTDDNQAELYVLLGTAQLLLNDDWDAGVECYVKSLEIDTQARFMKKFIGFYWRENTNLLELITNELRVKIKNGENEPVFNTFLQKAFLTHPYLERMSLNQTLYNKFKRSQLENRISSLEESSDESECED